MSSFDDVGWVPDFDVCTNDPKAKRASNRGENSGVSTAPDIDQKQVEYD